MTRAKIQHKQYLPNELLQCDVRNQVFDILVCTFVSFCQRNHTIRLFHSKQSNFAVRFAGPSNFVSSLLFEHKQQFYVKWFIAFNKLELKLLLSFLFLSWTISKLIISFALRGSIEVNCRISRYVCIGHGESLEFISSHPQQTKNLFIRPLWLCFLWRFLDFGGEKRIFCGGNISGF